MKFHHFHPHIWFISLFSLLIFLLALTLQNPLPNQFGKAQTTSILTIEGTLQVLHEDNFDNGEQTEIYLLQKDDKSIVFLDSSNKINIAPGSRVKVSGQSIQNLAPDSDPKISLNSINAVSEPSSLSRLQSQNQIKTAVIMLQFSDLYADYPLSKAQAAAIINGPTNKFFKENSYNKVSITAGPNGFGWYTSHKTATCNLMTIANRAVREADMHVNFNSINSIIIVFPANCTFSGAAFYNKIQFTTNDGDVSLSVAGIRLLSFINPDSRVINHELGHNLGAYHAGGLECGSSTINTQECQFVDAADTYDTMGYGLNPAGHYNAYYKEYYNWFSLDNIETVTHSGSHNIAPLEIVPATLVKTQMIKIPRLNSTASGNFYSVENRTKFGEDSDLPPSALNGALIKIIPNPSVLAAPMALDSTPHTNSGLLPILNDFYNSGFNIGQIFEDKERGIKITPLSKTNGILNVAVKFYGPTLLSPLNGSTASLRPDLSWQSIPVSKSHKIQIAKDDNFQNMLIDTNTNLSEFTPSADLQKGITYYWRVRETYPFGPSDWSQTFSFRIPNPLPAPTIIGPKNAVTVNSLQPTFKWSLLNPSPPVIELQIASLAKPSKDPFVTNLVYRKNNIAGTAIDFRLPVALNSNTPYVWKIRGLYTPDPSLWSIEANFNTL